MQLLKYRQVGADVHAVQVTDGNAVDVAGLTGGMAMTSPRTEQQYVLFETASGTQRADVGSYVVQHQDGSCEALTADEFAVRYERP